MQKNIKTAKILVGFGADIKIICNKGKTATEIIEYLKSLE